MAIYTESVQDTLVFAEILTTNQIVIQVNDTLVFVQSDSDFNLHQILHDRLIYIERLSYTLSANRSITDTLVFTQGAFKNEVGYVYQNLTFHETMNQGQFSTDILSFTETIDGVNTTGVNDLLAFTETIAFSIVKYESLSQTLTFTSTATAYLPTPAFINQPVTVPSTPTPTPSSTITVPAVPNVNPDIYFVTAYQYAQVVQLTSAKGRSIVLRAPDFGNTDAVGQTRIQRQTRGGDFIIYQVPFWPTSEEFALTFSYLDDQTVNALRDVINDTPGQLYTYVDHEGVSWKVIITTPELAVTTTNYPQVTFKLLVVKEADA